MRKRSVESVAPTATAEQPGKYAAAGNWQSRLTELWRLYLQSAPDTRGKLIASCALTVVAALLPLALVFVAALLADRAVGAAGGGLLGGAAKLSGDQLAAFLGLIALVTAAAVYFEMRWFAELGTLASVEFRKRLFGHLISLPLGFFAGRRLDEVDAMVQTDLEKLSFSWRHDWRLLLRNLSLFLATLIILFAIEAQLAVILLGALLLGLGGIAWLWKISPPQVDSGTGVFRAAVRFLPTLKSFANENYERGQLRHALSESSAADQRRTNWRSGVAALGGLLAMALIIFYLWYRAQQIAEQDGSFEAGRTLAFALLSAVLSVSAVRLAQVVNRLLGSSMAAQRLGLIFEEQAEQLEKGPYLPDSREALEGRVEFDKVCCSAEGVNGADGVVKDFDLSIEVGQKVALVGRDGDGQERLLELLLGLHKIDSGELRIDNRPLSDYPLAWLRSQIGWLSREPDFFPASIASNIGYGRPGASQQEIREAAENAGALEFIETLTNGFDTPMVVGANSREGFSPNREQGHRLAMARIFLKDPPLLAMQGIDPGEVNFGQTSDGQAKPSADGFARLALAEDRLIKGRTTVIVARRLSTTLDADHIIVLRGACIKEQGKHSELYDSNGYYRLLCESEFGRY